MAAPRKRRGVSLLRSLRVRLGEGRAGTAAAAARFGSMPRALWLPHRGAGSSEGVPLLAPPPGTAPGTDAPRQQLSVEGWEVLRFEGSFGDIEDEGGMDE